MDETVLKIAMAGFFHDIGKFADKNWFNISEQFLIDNADLYQPHYKENYTHRHAVYTAAFIDHIEKLLPQKLNQANWGLEDSFMNLAAGHHKPETRLQWIIATADGYTRTVIQLEKRDDYMDALISGSMEQDIAPLSIFLGRLVSKIDNHP